MGWSKVNNKYRKPFKWWFHKILCEYNWLIANHDYYYMHLKKMQKLGFNIYGEKI